MKIYTRILLILLAMAALVALIGGFAIRGEREVGLVGVTMGAEDVASILGYVYLADKDPAHRLTQDMASRLYKSLGHDVEIVDATGRLVADAKPETSLQQDHDLIPQVRETLRDGRPRTFIETNPKFPLGSREIAMPVLSDAGKVVAVIIMEYTPHYAELMKLTEAQTRQLFIAASVCAVIALCLTLYFGASIVRPLRQLTKAAAAFATGQTDTPMPPCRKDEIGDLTAAFNIMMERRRQAVEALRRSRDELELRVTERTVELGETNSRLQTEVANHRAAEEHAHRLEEQATQMAADMERERKRFEEILNNVPAVVWENWIAKDGSVRAFVSRRVEDVHGFTPEEWTSSPHFWSERVHPDDRERVLEAARNRISGENTQDEIDVFRWITKDGRVIWGETHISVIRNEDGTVCVRGFTLDITDQKEAEEKLEDAHRQLIDASRSAGMAEVATNVLHNVGNVLNSVNISAGLAFDHVRNSSLPHLARVAELFEENVSNAVEFIASPVGRKIPPFLGQLTRQLDSEQKSMLHELEHLCKNVEHIKDIVAVQQNYASVSGVSQPVQVAELVEDSLRMNTGALVRHDVQLLRQFEANPVIHVDKHKVMQILVNLIRNAKYACDESGRQDKRLTVRIDHPGHTVRVSVTDNGVGIPPENLTRIFSHGFTTRDNGHGFGLHSGALAAKEIGGSLFAQSDGPGLGASFILELPMVPPQS